MGGKTGISMLTAVIRETRVNTSLSGSLRRCARLLNEETWPSDRINKDVLRSWRTIRTMRPMLWFKGVFMIHIPQYFQWSPHAVFYFIFFICSHKRVSWSWKQSSTVAQSSSNNIFQLKSQSLHIKSLEDLLSVNYVTSYELHIFFWAFLPSNTDLDDHWIKPILGEFLKETDPSK